MGIEALGKSTMERKMEKMVSLKVIAGPVFFSLAVYLSWTLGRWFLWCRNLNLHEQAFLLC